jgi:hypothetical protein
MAARCRDAARLAERAGSSLRPTWPHVSAARAARTDPDRPLFRFRTHARAARVVPIPGSDHLGLCVDVALEPRKPN